MKTKSGGNANKLPELQGPDQYKAIPFMFNFKQVTTLINQDGSIWFIAKECCGILEYARSNDAVKTHCKYPKLLRHGEIPYLKINPRGEYIIPESDLYRLIANSHMPKAELFRDWLFEQVLPTIRKTGSYSVNPAASGLDYFKQAIGDPAKLQEMFAITLQELQNKNQIIAAQGKAIQTIQPKAIALDRMCAQDNDVCLNEAAKLNHYPPQAFNRKLGEGKWMYKRTPNGRWIPYSNIVKKGLLAYRLVPIVRSGGRITYEYQTMVTPKGLARISLIMGQRAIEKG